MSGQSPTLLQTLANRLVLPVDKSSRRRACLHVLDWLGCAVAGAKSDPARMLSASFAGHGCAPIIGGKRVSPAEAVLINGAFGNVLEMDDVHRLAILHPGPVVIPAALSAAVDQKAESEDFLNAVVRGYEAVIRIGRAVGKAHYKYFHNTATCGPFGAAAASASLYALSEEQLVWALANAGSTAGGLWQMRHEPTMTKQLHSGQAAESGWRAAKLAAAGFTGPSTLLEGEQGFFAALCSDGIPQLVVAELNDSWLIHQVSFKPWPACRHAHSAIDGAISLHPEINWKDIKSVDVRTYADAVKFCDKAHPRTILEAKFSIQHAVAMALRDGVSRLEHFNPECFDNVDVVACRNRIQVIEDISLSAQFPEHYSAHLTVKLKNGQQREVLIPDAYGDPVWPMSETDLALKASILMKAGGLSSDHIDRLVTQTLHLDEVNLMNWVSLLSAET